MRFRCEQCSTEYSLPDDAVARATRARCPRCNHSQALRPGGVPLTTPSSGKSQIGRVAITTKELEPTPEPEEELFGELDWETDTQLDFVVGRSHVQFDDVPAAPPKVAPVKPPSAPAPGPLQGSSSAPIGWTDGETGSDAAAGNRGGPQADEWPETDRSDPWKRHPLPPLPPSTPPPGRAAAPPGTPARPAPVPLPSPPAGPPTPIPTSTAGGHRRPQATPPGSVPAAIPTTPPRPIPGGTTPRPASRVTPAAGVPATPAEPCGACGGKLVDADDLASGVCGACRARTAAALGRAIPGATAAPSVPAEPELDLAARLPTPPAPRRHAFRAMPEPDHRRPMWLLLGLLAVVAAGTAGLWYLRVRPDPADLKRVADALPRPGKKKVPALAKLPDGLEARLASWKAPPTPRPMPELLASAAADLAKDTETSQLAAEKTLETALAEEPRNADALGLWMEAVARGRGSQLPAGEVDSLVTLGESALERLGRVPGLHVGLARLLLVRGGATDIERARALAQSAIDATRPPPAPAPDARPEPAPPEPPLSSLWGTRARLVLAEAYASSSAALALSLLQEVQQQDPAQRHVFNVRAAAHEAVGSPRAAVADLQARLAVDVDEPRTTRALARLWSQVGETTQARRLYERLQANPATQDGAAVVEMASLRAGPEHAPAEAAKLLARAVQHGKLAGTDLLRAQIALARVARAAGDLPQAAQAVAAALALSPDDVQAHVQAILIGLDQGAADQAATHLPVVLDHLGEPGLAALLEGKVLAAQQRWQAAAEAFDRAAAADSRRTDAALWGGAAWAMTGSRERALQSAAPALQADPSRDGPGIPPLWPGDGLKGAAERLVLLSKDDRDGQPLLAEAVLRVHQGDAAGAEALIDRILKAGGSQAVVLGWKSVLLGARGDTAGAVARAQEAVRSGGRTSGFAQFALGSALLASGDIEGAQRALHSAQSLSPGLLGAQVRLAEAEARAGAIVSARERLQRVIVLDPEYASARRALYLLPPEG